MNIKQITRLTASVLAILFIFAMVGIASAQEGNDTEIPAIGHTNPQESGLSTQALSTQAWATHCEGKIQAIQTQTLNILIKLENSNWMLLAKYGTTLQSTTAASAMLSTALTAHAKGETVKIRFPSGVSCANANYTNRAWMIRVVNY